MSEHASTLKADSWSQRVGILFTWKVREVMARPEKTAASSDTTQDSPAEKKTTRKGSLSTAEARREYQRRYYQMHKEKAKEYQRQYNLTHKKKLRAGRGKSSFVAQREVIRTTFHSSDLMHAPVEKTVRMIDKILSGERFFTM